MMLETTYMKLWVTELNFFGAKNFAPKIRKIDQISELAWFFTETNSHKLKFGQKVLG